MNWLRRVLGTFRAVWDIARQLGELRDEVQEIVSTVQEVVEKLQTLDERTRKQRYRDEQRDTGAPVQTPIVAPTAPPASGSRLDILRRAKAQGVIR